MKKALKIVWFALVILLASNLVFIAAQYFTFDKQHNFLKIKEVYIGNPIWKFSFYTHLTFGITAVITGLPLFFDKLIKFKSKIHKNLGKIYVFSILFLTGPTGLYLALTAEGGPRASIGFIIMSSLWMLITYRAFSKISLDRDVEGHYKWMIRSYCFTLSGITLRIMTPFCNNVLELDPETTYLITAYLPWIINLILGEIIVHLSMNTFKSKLV